MLMAKKQKPMIAIIPMKRLTEADSSLKAGKRNIPRTAQGRGRLNKMGSRNWEYQYRRSRACQKSTPFAAPY